MAQFKHKEMPMKLEDAISIAIAFPSGVVVKPAPTVLEEQVIDFARQRVRANALDAIQATREAWCGGAVEGQALGVASASLGGQSEIINKLTAISYEEQAVRDIVAAAGGRENVAAGFEQRVRHLVGDLSRRTADRHTRKREIGPIVERALQSQGLSEPAAQIGGKTSFAVLSQQLLAAIDDPSFPFPSWGAHADMIKQAAEALNEASEG